MAAEPTAWSGACGPNRARRTAAETRPCSPTGVVRCATSTTARKTHGRPKPRTSDPTTTAAGSRPLARSRFPRAKLACRGRRATSPMRRTTGLLVRLATMEPAPRAAFSTPRKLGGSPSACTRLYWAATPTPEIPITTAPASRIRRSSGVSRMGPKPATTSDRQRGGPGDYLASSRRSRRIMTAARANVPASRAPRCRLRRGRTARLRQEERRAGRSLAARGSSR